MPKPPAATDDSNPLSSNHPTALQRRIHSHARTHQRRRFHCTQPVQDRRNLPRVHDGACLIDLRCIPEDDDARVAVAARAALGALD